MPTDYQTFEGRTSACCLEMQWAISALYIRKGYLWRGMRPPKWISWSFHIQAEGMMDVSPIHFCPFCGTDLDAPEE